MESELSKLIEEIQEKIDLLKKSLGVDGLRARLSAIIEKTSAPDLWNNNDAAQALMKEQSDIEHTLASFDGLSQALKSNKELTDLEQHEKDPDLRNELEQTLTKLLDSAKTLEMKCFFSGPADANDCFIEIHAGAGGTESHDWAEMLYRMYMRFAEKQNFKFEIVHEVSGEEAGIKSVVAKVIGQDAFGWLKTESGVHRLVRLSPFNAAGKRQTSFASVWVYPAVDQKIDIDINESDLRIDTYKSSGAGGQHVNTTDSAVRITHIPTKVVVHCQQNRSQHRNKAEAMEMLKAKLYEIKLREEEERLQAENDKKTDNSWGNQIRSYVLQPYQMVKDHRSEFETSDTEKILDGHLQEMIFANLAYTMQKKAEK